MDLRPINITVLLSSNQYKWEWLPVNLNGFNGKNSFFFFLTFVIQAFFFPHLYTNLIEIYVQQRNFCRNVLNFRPNERLAKVYVYSFLNQIYSKIYLFRSYLWGIFDYLKHSQRVEVFQYLIYYIIFKPFCKEHFSCFN